MKTITLAVLGLSLILAHTSFAAGDVCSDVKITLSNTTPDEVKVTTFEYYDYDQQKWRTESMFGIDGFQKLEPNHGMTWTRDLEHVKNDNTKFRVTYEHHVGGTKWASPQKVTTNEFKCTKSLAKQVDLAK